jgi:hypothetical protein
MTTDGRSMHEHHDDDCEAELTSHGYTPCRCRERLEADYAATEVVEICLGCRKPTAERDCGCPAGTGLIRRVPK